MGAFIARALVAAVHAICAIGAIHAADWVALKLFDRPPVGITPSLALFLACYAIALAEERKP